MTEWKNISTAPKDGTFILIYDGEYALCKWGEAQDGNGWVSENYWASEDGASFRQYHPKKWHNLPEPPEAS